MNICLEFDLLDVDEMQENEEPLQDPLQQNFAEDYSNSNPLQSQNLNPGLGMPGMNPQINPLNPAQTQPQTNPNQNLNQLYNMSDPNQLQGSASQQNPKKVSPYFLFIKRF